MSCSGVIIKGWNINQTCANTQYDFQAFSKVAAQCEYLPSSVTLRSHFPDKLTIVIVELRCHGWKVNVLITQSQSSQMKQTLKALTRKSPLFRFGLFSLAHFYKPDQMIKHQKIIGKRFIVVLITFQHLPIVKNKCQQYKNIK